MILLNSQQQDALIKMDKFINSRNEKVFLLEGFAGTGKTTVITQLFGSRKYFKLDIVFSATTNKAVSVLQEMFKNDYEHIEFKTIHKLCKIKRKITNDGELTFNLNESPETFKKNQKTIFNYDIVIIDECSMISNKILSLILGYSNRIKGKIIFVGDRYQLPPVNEKISQVFEIPVTKYSLTKIVRCKDSVVEFSSRIRNSIDKKGNISTKGCKSDTFTTFKNSRSWLDRYVDGFNPGVSNVLLAYTNNRCNEINHYIREKIYGEQAKEEYVKNEIIIFNNYYKPLECSYDMISDDGEQIFIINENSIEAAEDVKTNSGAFYTSHKGVITNIQKIKFRVPSFPLESLFNINKKVDLSFKKIDNTKYDKEKDCPICFEKIKDRDSIETSCGHIFCEKCIKIWVEQNDQCPYCRMKLAEEQIVIKDDPALGTLINDFKKMTDKLDFDVWSLEINSPSMAGNILTPCKGERQRYESKLKDIKSSIHNIKAYICKDMKSKTYAKNLFIINRLWEYFYFNYIDLFADISYGYCLTVHKSQGSTFDDVYVDSRNILGFQNDDSLNCLYTAITRASKNINLLV